MSASEPISLVEIIIKDLQESGNKFEGKDLLASKLQDVTNFQDAYLDDDERKEINRILKKNKLPHRIQ